MNRRDFQRMAEIRAREALVLPAGRQYSGAYYLSGYVVECALKACIAKQTRRHEFPDRKAVNRSYTHDLEELVKSARLQETLVDDTKRNPVLEDNWRVVKDWTEESRYQRVPATKAIGLYNAVTDQSDGVFTWLQLHW